MAKAISNKNVADAKFNPAPFEGAFKAALGCPEVKGSWLIFGNSGVGKTTFALQLAKYLTNFVDKVAFDSLEQGLSLSLQKAWNRVGMEAVGAKVILLDKEGIPELRARLAKRKSPNVVIIDSVMCLIGLRMSDYQKLVNDFPNKLFVFLAHEDDKGKTVARHRRENPQVVRHQDARRGVQGVHDNAVRGPGKGRRRRGLRDMGGRRSGIFGKH